MEFLKEIWIGIGKMSKAKFVLSKDRILEQYEKVDGISDIVSYSSKTNPIVTGVLEENTDSFFSLHMKNELKNVKDKKRVIFLAQAWIQEDISELIELGVRWFVVDNERDLQEIVSFLDTSDVKINLLLRVKLKENTLKTEKYFVFGMSVEKVREKLGELRSHKGIEKLGIHFHRKTQNMAEWNLKREFSGMFELSDLKNIDFVCVGGGIPSEYANTDIRVLGGIFERIKEFREFLNGNSIKMILEPGRFIAAPAGKLHCRILSVHDNNIIVNASIYNSDMDALIVPVKLLIEGEKEKSDPGVENYVVKGITPCSMDLFRYRVYLNPKDVKEGEEIVFLNAGAYNFSSDFCDLEKLDTEIV